jgi:hypothetical protein
MVTSERGSRLQSNDFTTLKILTVPRAPGPVLSAQLVSWLGQRAARHIDGRSIVRRDVCPSTCGFQLHDI